MKFFVKNSLGAVGSTIGKIVKEYIDERVKNTNANYSSLNNNQADQFNLEESIGKTIPIVFGIVRVKATPVELEIIEENDRKYANAVLVICEGPIDGTKRIWINQSLAKTDNFVRNKNIIIEKDGIKSVKDPEKPWYKGLALIILNKFPLDPYNKQLPIFEIETVCSRRYRASNKTLEKKISGIALAPGVGEFSYAPFIITSSLGKNINTSLTDDIPDFLASIQNLHDIIPSISRFLFTVTWFADSNKPGQVNIKPAFFLPNDLSYEDSRSSSEIKWHFGSYDKLTSFNLGATNITSYLHQQDTTSAKLLLSALKTTNITSYPHQQGTTSAELLVNAFTNIKLRFPNAKIAVALKIKFLKSGINEFDTPYSDTDVKSFFRSINGYKNFVEECAEEVGNFVDTFYIGYCLSSVTKYASNNNTFPAIQELIKIAEHTRAILPRNVQVSYIADWSDFDLNPPKVTTYKTEWLAIYVTNNTANLVDYITNDISIGIDAKSIATKDTSLQSDSTAYELTQGHFTLGNIKNGQSLTINKNETKTYLFAFQKANASDNRDLNATLFKFSTGSLNINIPINSKSVIAAVYRKSEIILEATYPIDLPESLSVKQVLALTIDSSQKIIYLTIGSFVQENFHADVVSQESGSSYTVDSDFSGDPEIVLTENSGLHLRGFGITKGYVSEEDLETFAKVTWAKKSIDVHNQFLENLWQSSFIDNIAMAAYPPIVSSIKRNSFYSLSKKNRQDALKKSCNNFFDSCAIWLEHFIKNKNQNVRKEIIFAEWGFPSITSCAADVDRIRHVENIASFNSESNEQAQLESIYIFLSAMQQKNLDTDNCLSFWDIRPYPALPALKEKWIDQNDYSKNQNIQGKITGIDTADLAASFLQKISNGEINVVPSYRRVKGFLVDREISIRELINIIKNTWQICIRKSASGYIVGELEDLNYNHNIKKYISLSSETSIEKHHVVANIMYINPIREYKKDIVQVTLSDNSTYKNASIELSIPATMASEEIEKIGIRLIKDSKNNKNKVKLLLPLDGLALESSDLITLEYTNSEKIQIRILSTKLKNGLIEIVGYIENDIEKAV